MLGISYKNFQILTQNIIFYGIIFALYRITRILCLFIEEKYHETIISSVYVLVCWNYAVYRVAN